MNEETQAIPALHEDTLVHTARGLVTIKDVQPGDVVFSFDEQGAFVPAEVGRRLELAETELLEVRVGHRRIRASNDTPMLTLVRHSLGKRRGRYERVWRALHEVRVGDVVGFARATPDLGKPREMNTVPLNLTRTKADAVLPKTSSPRLMWWFGLYLGDGSIEYRPRDAKPARVQLAVYEDTEPVLHRIAAATAAILFGVPASSSVVSGLRISSRRLAEYLVANGLGGTALVKRIPEWVSTTPTDQRLAFLAGYVDADGTVGTDRNLTITSANPDLLGDAGRLARSCGLGASALMRFRMLDPWTRRQERIGYRIAITGDCRRIPCRDSEKERRLSQRSYSQTGGGLKRADFGDQVSHWLGFGRVEDIRPIGRSIGAALELITGANSVVAEGLLVRLSPVCNSGRLAQCGPLRLRPSLATGPWNSDQKGRK